MFFWPRHRAAQRRKAPVPPQEIKPGHGEFDQVAPYYDLLMSSVPYRHWVNYVEQLIALAGAPVRRVLDLACGTGKVGSEMLRRGYEVVGADLSEQMVRLCARQEPPLPAVVMDATALGLRANCFDLVVCLYDSLNYILDPEGLRQGFRRVQEALQPGGLFIFDLNTPRALRIGLFTQSNLRRRSPMQYQWEAHWSEAERLCRVDMWFYWQGEGGPLEFEETHYQRAYEEPEVRSWLREAGFAGVQSYDAYTLNPVRLLSDRMFFVVQKGKTK